jgi:alpha-methylacyl-CoA racemase
MTLPLSGYRFIELAGIGPCPYAGQLFVDMGAEVILINRKGGMNFPNISHRGKKTMMLDLRTNEGVDILLNLIKSADALYEGLRPGVVEKLGIGPQPCQAANPKLVYGRMTGWGQTGPLAKTAGHDINYIGLTGALHAMGKEGEVPPVPLNLIGDYGGGSLFLVSGILAALLQAEKTGKGSVVDAAMVDGVSSMMSLFYTLSGFGQWTPKRESNLLDGSKPFYRCYETADDKFMAVGCIEPQFFAKMLSLLKIDPSEFGAQNDIKAHPQQQERLTELFRSKTRNEWAEVFDGTDACVTPVLDYQEAASHPHNKARGGQTKVGPFEHPRPTPVFNPGQHKDDYSPPAILGLNDSAKDILAELGYSDAEISALHENKVVGG